MSESNDWQSTRRLNITAAIHRHLEIVMEIMEVKTYVRVVTRGRQTKDLRFADDTDLTAES